MNKLSLILSIFIASIFVISSASASIIISSPLNITYEQYGSPEYNILFNYTTSFNALSCKLNYTGQSDNVNILNGSQTSWFYHLDMTTGTYVSTVNCSNMTGTTFTNQTTFTIESHAFSLISLSIAGLLDIVMTAGLLFFTYQYMIDKKFKDAKEFGFLGMGVIIGFVMIQVICMMIAGA